MRESVFTKMLERKSSTDMIGTIRTREGVARMKVFCPPGELMRHDRVMFTLELKGKEVGNITVSVISSESVNFYHLYLKPSLRNQADAGEHLNVAEKWLAEAEKFLRSRGIRDIEAWFYKPDTLYFLEKHGYGVAPVVDQQHISKRLKRLDSVRDYIDFEPEEKEGHGNLMLRKKL